jgi:hypothetical protein
MFQLSLVDHIRLSFASVVGAYQGHSEAASRLASWGWYAKLATLAMVGLAAAASLLALRKGGAFLTVAATTATIAFVATAVYVAVDPEPRVYGHRMCAARLWLLCEKYRALLTEIHDELLDVAAITTRRDGLLQEVGAVFEQVSPADRYTYDIAQKALAGAHRGGYSDQDVDRLLPPSLRRVGAPSA